MWPARSALALTAALTAVLVVGTSGARSQVPLPTSTTTTEPPPTTTTTGPRRSTTTTTPPSTSTTTSTTTAPPDPGGAENLVPTSTTSTTTPPPPGPGPAPGTGRGGPAPGRGPTPGLDAPGPGGDGGPGGEAPFVIPPDVQARINAVRRSRPNSTRRLLEALRALEDLGFTPEEAVQAGFGSFPVGGYATFSDDWLLPRFTPVFHLHQGTDIFAAFDTPARAPAAGTLKRAEGGAGGLAAYVYQADGTYYYLAHLRRFVAGQVSGQKVERGQVIGYVGDSGNAQGGAPHVHFEIHPAPVRKVTTGKGRARRTTLVPVRVPVGTDLPAVDPKSQLDRWVDEALVDVPRLLGDAEAGRPRALIATGMTRRLAGIRGEAGAPSGPPRAQLLWASSASPSGGPLRLAEAEATAAAREVDWSALARRQQARAEAKRAAEARARAVLAPLTPQALRRALRLT